MTTKYSRTGATRTRRRPPSSGRPPRDPEGRARGGSRRGGRSGCSKATGQRERMAVCLCVLPAERALKAAFGRADGETSHRGHRCLSKEEPLQPPTPIGSAGRFSSLAPWASGPCSPLAAVVRQATVPSLPKRSPLPLSRRLPLRLRLPRPRLLRLRLRRPDHYHGACASASSPSHRGTLRGAGRSRLV